MDSNIVQCFLYIIKYYSEYMDLISGQFAVRMPVQAMHHERFSKHFLQLFSVRSLHSNYLLIISRLQKTIQLNPCKFQKVDF
jgi:hypothetical protein